MKGRIEGRVAGDCYELVQRGVIRKRIPLVELHDNPRWHATIAKNKWEALP